MFAGDNVGGTAEFITTRNRERASANSTTVRTTGCYVLCTCWLVVVPIPSGSRALILHSTSRKEKRNRKLLYYYVIDHYTNSEDNVAVGFL